MTPFLAQTLVVLVVLVTLIVLLLMGYLLRLQRRDVAESNRQGDAQRPRLSRRRARGHPWTHQPADFRADVPVTSLYYIPQWDIPNRIVWGIFPSWWNGPQRRSGLAWTALQRYPQSIHSHQPREPARIPAGGALPARNALPQSFGTPHRCRAYSL